MEIYIYRLSNGEILAEYREGKRLVSSRRSGPCTPEEYEGLIEKIQQAARERGIELSVIPPRAGQN